MGAEKKEEAEEEDDTESKGSPKSKKVLLTLLCYVHLPTCLSTHPPIHPFECLPTSLPQKVRRFRIEWLPNVKEIKDSSDEVNNISYYQSVLLYIF